MSTPRVRGTNDLDLLVLVEIQQVDLAQRIEVVARARQNSLHRVLDLDSSDEPAPPLAASAHEGTPGGAVVPASLAVRALPKIRVADRYSSHVRDITKARGGNL